MSAPASSTHNEPIVLCRELRRLGVSDGIREEDEDRLGALPDDVLLLVLRRLDTRSALATAALSRRWARLPRELPALEFNVGDILPERYCWYLRRRLDADNLSRPWSPGTSDKLATIDHVLGPYERRVMRSLAASLGAFLDADAAAETRRRVRRLRLEIFRTHKPATLDRLVTTAVGAWGAEDMEVVVLNPHGPRGWRTPFYSFPHGYFAIHFPDGTGEVRLKRLKLTNCAPYAFVNSPPVPAPWRAFGALTVLILRDMPRSTPSRVYRKAIRLCPALEVLHLKSCGCDAKSFTVDAHSRITELLFELTSLRLRMIDLSSALPRLQRLAYVGAPVELKLGAAPRLACVNLAFHEDESARPTMIDTMGLRNCYVLGTFLRHLTGVEDIVLRFTGPEMWVLPPSDDMPPLGKLRRLLVADMPPSWDITWTRYLLEAAPCLETLHVHVAAGEDVGSVVGNKLMQWPPSSDFKHLRLGEVVIGGFQGTPRQMQFLKFLRAACTSLREVVLLRHGVVREKGLWDWEKVVPQQDWQWIDEDRGAVLREIEDGTDAVACSSTQIVFC